MENMKILGITGGVGSGKSEVLNYMEAQYDACVCQMDEVAKQLEKSGEACFQKIVDQFGDSVIGNDGELDRKKLGEIVFSDSKKLEILNEIVHPAVLEYTAEDIIKKRREGKKLYVLESALLVEIGHELCDEIWYIYAEENVRRSRLEQSRGYTQEKITRMIASQPSEEKLREICTDRIDNSGDFEETKRQIGEKIQL